METKWAVKVQVEDPDGNTFSENIYEYASEQDAIEAALAASTAASEKEPDRL